MQVKLNTALYSPKSFKSNDSYKRPNSNILLTKDEIATKKIKRSVSELTYIFLGVGILYFGMKRTFKYDKIARLAKKAEELAKVKRPEVKMPKLKFDNLLPS